MPLASLGAVTRSLLDLLKRGVEAQLPPASSVKVTPLSPDKVASDAQNTLAFYLYHLTEHPSFKNLPPLRSVGHVEHTPMALTLFYILTVHHEGAEEEDEDFAPYWRQRLMGHAMKTFHDVPIVDDDTTLGGPPILVDSIRGLGNRLELSLRPIEPEEALSFWANEERQITRLSAYYEVSAVLLEPEPLDRVPGIVSTVGLWSAPRSTPVLHRSRSAVSFVGPDGRDQTLTVTPARIALSAGGPTDWPHRRLVLEGEALGPASAGSDVWLRHPSWRDLGVREARVDPSWIVDWTERRIIIDVEPTLSHEGSTLDLVPGTYGARVAHRSVQIVAGERIELRSTSAEVSFGIGPRIASPPTVASGLTTLGIDPEVDLTAADDVEVALDGVRLVPTTESTPAAGTVRLEPHELVIATPAAGLHALRLLVDGVDAQPYWWTA